MAPRDHRVEGLLASHQGRGAIQPNNALVEAAQKSVAANPTVWQSHYFLAVGYEGSGLPLQAVPEYQQAIELSQRNSDTIAGLAHVYATMGRAPDAENILSELQRQLKMTYVSP